MIKRYTILVEFILDVYHVLYLLLLEDPYGTNTNEIIWGLQWNFL